MTATPDELVADACRHHERAGELAATGDFAEARAEYEASVALLEAAVGPAHPDVANVLGGLGQLLQSLDDLTAAEGCFRRALAIMEPLGGDPVLDRLRVQARRNLGDLLRAAGRYDEARQ